MMIKYLLLILTFLTFSFSTAEAVGVTPVYPPAKKTEILKSRIIKNNKRFPKPKPGKSDNPVLSSIFWYGFMPLTIAAAIIISFLIPGLAWLWFLGLGLFSIWAGVNGIVFFPLQFAGLPLGMAFIIYGIIIKSVLILSLGVSLAAAALFAFSYMVLMFTIGTRKNQPK